MREWTVLIFVVFFMSILFITGMQIGENNEQARWQAEAVKHGAAEYDQMTGKWQWKVKDGKEDD